MTPLAKLRLRAGIAAAAALLIVAAMVVNPSEGVTARDRLADGAMALLGLAAVLAYLWFLIDRGVLRPLDDLTRAALRAAEADPDRPLADAAPPPLRPLAAAIDALLAARGRRGTGR